jgi:cell division septation protein DedD
MTRVWRKLAIAALAAAVLVPFHAPQIGAQPKQPAKAAKAPAAEDTPSDENNDEAKAPAKKKRQDPVEAQRAIEGANKLLQSGKAEQATQALTATLAGGNLPPAVMAKALYLRGVAYRQQGKPAQAISDLTSALWLKGGLADSDRADAMKQRTAAYGDAGLTETGEAVTAAPAAKERQASAKGWGATTSPDEGSGSSAPLGGNWFKDWFSGWQNNNSSQSEAPPKATTGSIQKETAPPAAQPAAPPSPARVASAWSSKTEVQPETAALVERGPAPAAAKFEGKFRVQLAIVRTEEEARALVVKAKRELAGALAAREPEIDQAVLGNMGAFYRVRVGPYATIQESQAVCARIKGTGFDCMAVTH